MHHIYTTEAIIIKTVSVGEANRLYFILTKELGLIKATAQGVRLNKSKLNGHLQTFCLIKLSVVRGRDIWRITSVESIIQNNFKVNFEGISILHNISNLLLRLVQGEEKNESLFESVKSVYFFCIDTKLSIDDLNSLEVLSVLRIMYFLGYIKKNDEVSFFVDSTTINREIIDNFIKIKKQVILQINTALRETHL